LSGKKSERVAFSEPETRCHYDASACFSFYGTGAKSEVFHSCVDLSFLEQGVRIQPEHASLLEEARGNSIMMKKAYETFKSQLEATPDNISLKLACADALVSMMRIVGNANALLCEFKSGRKASPVIKTSDTPENQAYWTEMAPLAQQFLTDIEKYLGAEVFSKQPFLFALALEALMYATSAKGVVAAAVSGYAPSFLLRVARFESMHPEYDGSQYCIYRGAFFLAAPWPAYNARKGHEFFELGIQKEPSSRRNQYFAGVGRFAVGDFRGAREAMEISLQSPSPSSTELDIRDFLTKEATRVIGMLKERGY